MTTRRRPYPDEDPKTDIMAAQDFLDNGALIADVARLHLHRDWKCMDVTYGEGVWWNAWWPKKLTIHDWKIDGVDFRKLPHRSNTFDCVAYDPPYVAQGGRKTGNLPYNERYGLLEIPPTPELLQSELINPGLTEVHRVLKWPTTPRGKDGGLALVKCMNYISSNTYKPHIYWTMQHAESLGFVVEDISWFIGDVRMQPGGRVQRHFRNNMSCLMILRKDRPMEESNDE